MSDGLTRQELVSLLIRSTIFGIITYFGIKWTIDAIDPTRKQKRQAQIKAEMLLNRLGVNDKTLSLTEYELAIAAQLVDPHSIDVSWNDIAGLEDVIEDIKATVILPMKSRELFFHSTLHQPPKGVLLHGPPGCGKTMIAKATAKEAGARFINLEIPCLTDKWYGESQKLAAAVFTLALKLQPCIVFIDEIDTFLRSRDSHDHEATAMMKAQFMMLWDGLASAKYCQVIVMGATNRPHDVDKAILRRMPAMFQINLPSKHKRTAILKLILDKESIDSGIDLEKVADLTDGFSGSDLKELCRTAAMYRVKEISHASYNEIQHTSLDRDSYINLRSIVMDDFTSGVHKMKESKMSISSSHSFIGLD